VEPQSCEKKVTPVKEIRDHFGWWDMLQPWNGDQVHPGSGEEDSEFQTRMRYWKCSPLILELLERKEENRNCCWQQIWKERHDSWLENVDWTCWSDLIPGDSSIFSFLNSILEGGWSGFRDRNWVLKPIIEYLVTSVADDGIYFGVVFYKMTRDQFRARYAMRSNIWRKMRAYPQHYE
jgi:hypothetical protein